MRLLIDGIIIGLSIAAAIFLVNSPLLEWLLYSTTEVRLLGAFIAGLFFTSAFTTPISIAAFAEISKFAPIAEVAAVGAVGAVIGDLVIFYFIRDRLAEDIEAFLKSHHKRKVRSVFKFRMFRWLMAAIGALIIASPVPDEIGLAMMGFSKMKTAVLIPLSFLMNFLGILAIAAVAHAL